MAGKSLFCVQVLIHEGDWVMTHKSQYYRKEIFNVTHSFLGNKRHDSPHTGTWGTPGSGQRAGAGVEVGVGGPGLKPWSLLGFLWERQGRVGCHLGLASLNNFGRLWALGVVSSCLEPALGWSKQRKFSPGVRKPDREGRAPDWLVWISDSMPLARKKNWLALERAVSLQTESFLKMSKHHKI